MIRALGIRLFADAAPLEAGMKRGSQAVRGFQRDVEGSGRRLDGVSQLMSARVLGVTAAVATMGKVLHSGWQRFTTIEDAAASLSITLGDTDRVASLLGATLKVVQGTPFNLDQFIRAGKNLIAVGEDASRVPKILTAVGEAAASSGNGAAGVDTIVDSMQRMLALGRVYADELNSLSAQGVPALQILANTWGVNTDQMREMISDGAVPARKAIDALVEGIMHGTKGMAGETRALAGSMEELRKTTSGALGGLSAAGARLGAGVLGMFGGGEVGEVNQLASVITALTDRVDGLTTGLKTIAPPVQAVTGFLAKHFEIVEALAILYGTRFTFSLLQKVGGGLYDIAAGAHRASGGLTVLTAEQGMAEKLANKTGIAYGRVAGQLGLMAAAGAGAFVLSELNNAKNAAEAYVETLKEGLDVATDEGWRELNDRLREQIAIRVDADVADQGDPRSQGTRDFFRTIFDANFRQRRAELDKLSAELEEQTISKLNESTNVEAIAARTGTRGKGTAALIREFAQAAGADLSSELARSEPERQKVIDHMNSIATTTGLAIDEIAAAGSDFMKTMEETEKAAADTSKSFREAFDIFSTLELPDPTQAAKDAVAATDKLTEAEDRLAEAREKQKDTQRHIGHSPALDREQAEARRAVADAERDVAAAREEANEATKRQLSPEESIARQYEKDIAAAKQYVQDLGAAAKQGVDIDFLLRAQKAGPEASAGILRAIAADPSGELKGIINESERQLEDLAARSESIASTLEIGAHYQMEVLDQTLKDGIEKALTGDIDPLKKMAYDLGAQIAAEVQRGIEERTKPGGEWTDPAGNVWRNLPKGQSGPPIPVKDHAFGGIDPHIATSPTVLYGERSTGGEAFIPLGLHHRDRSRDLMMEVAQRFGDHYVPAGDHDAARSLETVRMASGGFVGSTYSYSGPSTTKITHSRRTGDQHFHGDMHFDRTSPQDFERWMLRKQRLDSIRGDGNL